jgi:hypothetical protein
MNRRSLRPAISCTRGSAFGRRAALAACLFAAAFTVAPAARADVPISDNARVHFKAGVNLLQDPGGARYEDAYREFKAAYAASPSPRILGNMGLCAMKLERDGEAIQAYEAYLAGVPDMSADEKRQTMTDLATLKAGASSIALKVEPAAATIVDVRMPVTGGNVTNVYAAKQGALALLVRPGHHAVTVKADGYASQTFEVEATPGAKLEHTVTLERPHAAAITPEPGPAVSTVKTRPIPTYVYVAGGASVALALGGIVTGSLALKQNSDFKAANNGSDPMKAGGIRSTGETLNVVTDIFFVSALVGGGLTAYLFASRPTVEAPDGAPSRTGSHGQPGLASLRLEASPTTLVIDGTF